MSDIFDKEKRSEVMSRIKGRNTEAERIVFRYLRQENVHFRKHYTSKELGMNLDVALPSKRRAVLIDGDFWHGKNYTARKEKLSKFWRNKIEENMERDRRQEKKLEDAGWKILRIWESNIKRKSTRERELGEIKKFLTR